MYVRALNCPFCGTGGAWVCLLTHRRICVTCDECGAHGPEVKMTSRHNGEWNRRAEQKQEPEEGGRDA